MFAEVEQTEEGVHFQPEQLASIEAALAATANVAELNTQIQSLTKKATDVQNALDAANNTIAERDAQIVTLNEKLSQRPGSQPSASTQTEDPIQTAKKNRFEGMKTDLKKYRKTNS